MKTQGEDKGEALEEAIQQLDLGLQTPDLRENKFWFFMPAGLLSFGMAALAHII